MSTPDSATNPLNSDQLMRTLLLDTQRQAEELSLLAQVIERLPITLGVNGRVVRTATPALVPDVRQDPAFIASMEGILSEVCVPLLDQGVVVGTLNVESTNRVLNETDLRLILALSEH